MISSGNIASLQILSSNLLDDTLTEIRLHRKESSPPNEEYFPTAEYLLQEAMEYVAGAWEMVKSGKSNASIALSRWVLEASLNLLWIMADEDKIEERHTVLIGEALRNDACLLEGLAKLQPDESHQFESKANEARRIRNDLGVEKPESLEKRLEKIRIHDKANWPELYSLYRICCAAAHPSLKVWERFVIADNSTVYKDPIDKKSLACWMVTASTFYLVMSTYCLTELGDSAQLKDWWKNKVWPLLNDD
ncbi:MAG: hypothetical protein AMJ43_09830 [Coxiella sp. DG_40]|nr:MAG: hypothetical protein AMJ43_09830 [Coxiella sp. DG_40]